MTQPLMDCNLTKEECLALGYCSGHKLHAAKPLTPDKPKVSQTPHSDTPNNSSISNGTPDTNDGLECKCRPINDNLTYTGDCPIHQAKVSISLEDLKKSNNPEAKAILRLMLDTFMELIGEDDPTPIVRYDYGYYPEETAAARNELRAELRKSAQEKLKL